MDNSILSIGTINLLKSFGITTPEELKTATLPAIDEKPSFYATRTFKQKHLNEVNLYLLKLKIDTLIGKVIRVTSSKYEGEHRYNVIGYDKYDDVIMKATYYPKSEPFTVDKVWFNEELTNRIIEVI